MRELVFFLEEPSARALLETLLPRLLSAAVAARYIVFEGKQDLERQLIRKLRGYLNPGAHFIILRDQDSADCKIVKNALKNKCIEAGKEEALVRIACRELESWYLADLAAVGSAFSQDGLARLQQKEKFRNPDQLGNPYLELKSLVPEYQKIDGSRRIGLYLDITEKRSRSFQRFIEAIKNCESGA
jgi:hypothetical protein